MSKTCNNCGNIMDDDANICARCGTQYVAIQPSQPEQHSDNSGFQPQQQQYQQQYQHQPYQMPYQQPQYQQPVEQPMGVGSWLATILLTSLFGVISLVLLFVWAFGSNVPTAKKNYCRAMLILEAIGTVLAILLLILFVTVFSSSGILDEFFEDLKEISSAI